MTGIIILCISMHKIEKKIHRENRTRLKFKICFFFLAGSQDFKVLTNFFAINESTFKKIY